MFGAIQAFGDSYADTGNLFKLLGAVSGTVPDWPLQRWHQFRRHHVAACWAFRKTTLPSAARKIGSDQRFGPGIPGFTQEWQGFVASVKKIAPSDLVEMSMGGNDARAYY